VVVVLVLLTITAFLIVDHFVRRTEAERGLTLAGAGALTRTAAVGADALGRADTWPLAEVPAGTFLAVGHTWVRATEEGLVRLGADALPVHALGGLDHVQLLAPGTQVRVGQPVVTLGRGRRLIRLHAPVGGTIVEANPVASGDPARVGRDPFRTGWLYSIRPQALAPALRRMFVAEEAASWMRRELGRLRDAIGRVTASRAEPVPVLLDGGVPIGGFADRLSDEQWVAIVETLFEHPAESPTV